MVPLIVEDFEVEETKPHFLEVSDLYAQLIDLYNNEDATDALDLNRMFLCKALGLSPELIS